MKNALLKSGYFLLTILVVNLLQGCIKGEGPIVQQAVSISDPISGVKAMGSFDVIVTLGTAQSVTAEGQQNIIDRLITRVTNEGVLELELERGNYKDFEMTVYVTIPTGNNFILTGSGDMTVVQSEGLRLDSLTLNLSGSGDLKGLGEFLVDGRSYIKLTGSGDVNFNIETGQLESDLSGSGDINLNFEAGEADVNITGSGHCNFTGFAPTQVLSNSGSGDYRGFGVYSSNTTAVLTGSGEVECRASSQLNATLSGSGDLLYKGTPVISSTVTGTGIVRDAN